MGNSTREGGPDDNADIIDLLKRPEFKDAVERNLAAANFRIENPATASEDKLSAGRTGTRGSLCKVIRLNPIGKRPIKKSRLTIVTVSDAIRNNQRRAANLKRAKTVRIDGLHPINQDNPTKVISGGSVRETPPQALADRDTHIKSRGQVRVDGVFRQNEDCFEHGEDRISPDVALAELMAITVTTQRSNQISGADAAQNNGKVLFNEVALILLKMFGKTFSNFLNDQRVESVCILLRDKAAEARIQSVLTTFRTTTV